MTNKVNSTKVLMFQSVLIQNTTVFFYASTCLLHYLLSLLHDMLSNLFACLLFFLLANLLAASRSLLFLSNSSIHPGFAIIFHGFDLPAKKCRQNFIITVTDRISWKYQILRVWNWRFAVLNSLQALCHGFRLNVTKANWKWSVRSFRNTWIITESQWELCTWCM